MKKTTEIILLISVIVIAFVVIYFVLPGSPVPASSNTYTAPAAAHPVVEIVDTTAGLTSYGAPEFYGTVKSNTGTPVTADIAAEIYDESGRVQLANGDSQVSIAPYGQSPYEVIIHKYNNIPQNWEYRIFVEDVY